MINRIVQIVRLFLLLAIPVYLSVSFYYLDKSYFLCPIKYLGDVCIRSDSRGDGEFAARRSGRRMHNGVDLLAEVGTPVVACKGGYARVFEQKNGMGNYIVIYHPDNLSTLYGHLSAIMIPDGILVRQGQVIGKTGKTGNSNHPDIQAHLHFEVRKNGVLQNPRDFLE